MTFPTTPTAGANTLLTSSQATATTTHTFPSLTTLDNASGDLLLAIIVTYLGGSTNADFSSWGGGFTEFVDQSTNSATVQSIGAAYKFSDGTETGTFTVTSAGSTRSVMFLLSVKGAHASTVPEATARATGTTGAADPASLNPANWDVEQTLWIAVGVNGETSLTGTFTGITAAPTNYTGYVDSGIIGGDVIGALEGALGFRQNAVAAEDVGGFTLDTGAAGNSALLIAVRPAPSIVTGTIVSNFGFTASAVGASGVPITIAGLVLWWKAEDLSGLSDGAAVGTSGVSPWASRVGTASALQATSGFRPTKQTVSSKTCVRFDGIDDSLVLDGTALTATQNRAAVTVLVKAKVNALPTGVAFFAGFSVGNSAFDTRVSLRTDLDAKVVGLHRRTDLPSSSQIVLGGSYSTGTIHTFSTAVDFANTDCWVWLNGTEVASETAFLDAGTTTNTASLVATIGSGEGGAENLSGDIYEVLFYDHVLDSAERAAVEAYLADVAAGVVMAPTVSPSRPVRSWR